MQIFAITALITAAVTFATIALPHVIQAFDSFVGGVQYIYGNIPAIFPSIWATFPYALKMFAVSVVAIAVIGGILGKVFNHV